MQSRNPFMDDLSRVMQGAAGMAQAANDEAKALFRSMAERLVGDMDLAHRDEVEALKTLARSAAGKGRGAREARRRTRSEARRRSPDRRLSATIRLTKSLTMAPL